MEKNKRRESSSIINQVWDLYFKLQTAITLSDARRCVELITLLHDELCNLSNGTLLEQRMMMDWETNILPSLIYEICDISESTKKFILGKRQQL